MILQRNVLLQARRATEHALGEAWECKHATGTFLADPPLALLPAARPPAHEAGIGTLFLNMRVTVACVEELLGALADWLCKGRDELRAEFEEKLRESYAWPVTERRRIGTCSASAVLT